MYFGVSRSCEGDLLAMKSQGGIKRVDPAIGSAGSFHGWLWRAFARRFPSSEGDARHESGKCHREPKLRGAKKRAHG